MLPARLTLVGLRRTRNTLISLVLEERGMLRVMRQASQLVCERNTELASTGLGALPSWCTRKVGLGVIL